MDISELNRINKQKNFCRHPWEVARARAIEFLLGNASRRYDKILDIGSGDSFVLGQLVKKNLGREYVAVDTAYTPELLAQLGQAEESKQIAFYTEVPGNMTVDCVLILDVIEHCKNDEEVVRESVRAIENNSSARVLVTVPAFQGLFAQHDHLLGHHRRYSRKQLRALMKKAGLEIVKDGYFFFSLIPVRISQLLMEKLQLRKAKKSIDDWNGNRTFSKIISTILWADFRICHFLSRLGIHLPGLSCYCLCKKSPS